MPYGNSVADNEQLPPYLRIDIGRRCRMELGSLAPPSSDSPSCRHERPGGKAHLAGNHSFVFLALQLNPHPGAGKHVVDEKLVQPLQEIKSIDKTPLEGDITGLVHQENLACLIVSFSSSWYSGSLICVLRPEESGEPPRKSPPLSGELVTRRLNDLQGSSRRTAMAGRDLGRARVRSDD